MGIKINNASIKAKLSRWAQSGAAKERIREAGRIKIAVGGKGVHTPEEAADKFISVLRSTIISSGLSANAVNAVSELDCSSPVSLGDGKYEITVYFSGDLFRPSLHEGGIDDIVLLLNNGVSHEMKPVYGTWHGERIRSRTVISGAHFIEQAVSDFMGNYSAEYGVTKIEPQM